MKEFIIGKNDAEVRLDKFVAKAVPSLPSNLIQKYIRLKRIKVNSTRAKADMRLAIGDTVSMYLNDEFFETKGGARDDWRKVSAPKLSIAFEDENILIVDKKPGAFIRLGTRNAAKGCVTLPHNNDFLLDEDALPLGSQIFVQFVLDNMGGMEI